MYYFYYSLFAQNIKEDNKITKVFCIKRPNKKLEVLCIWQESGVTSHAFFSPVFLMQGGSRGHPFFLYSSLGRVQQTQAVRPGLRRSLCRALNLGQRTGPPGCRDFRFFAFNPNNRNTLKMAGAIIENMSTKKLVIVGVILLLFQAFSFMVGGLIGE